MAAVDTDLTSIRKLFNLSGKKAVVTGGGGGIGFAILLGFKEIYPTPKALKYVMMVLHER